MARDYERNPSKPRRDPLQPGRAEGDAGQRLDLFIKVCQAIQHAHRKGIVHRNIKPSNVLVTVNDGVVLVALFLGLPRVTRVRFSPDASLFAASSAEGYARVYDTPTFEPMATLGDGRGSVDTVRFMEEGDRLILGGGLPPAERSRGFVAIWDVATRLELVRLEVEDGVADVDFSQDGNVLMVKGLIARYHPPRATPS